MKLTDYIFGSRRGREANAVEREAMTDPFLAEALDGYDEVYGDHAGRLASLSQRVAMASNKRPAAGGGRRGRMAAIYGGVAAAAAVIVLALFIFTGRQPEQEQLVASADTVPGRTEAPLPPSAALRGSTPASEEASESALADSEADSGSGSYKENGSVLMQEDAVTTANLSGIVSDNSLADEEITEESSTVTADVLMDEKNTVSETAVVTAETFMTTEAVAFDAMPKAAMAETHMLTRSATVEPAPAVKVSEVNPEFEKYWIENRLVLTLSDGTPLMGDIIVEFEVNDAGIPSSIRIVSGLSRDSNREIIDMLVSGPRWTPTAGERITVIITY